MVPHMEKPRVTEFQVRIDCNGCVQKIKKALNGINGIQDIYIDIPQQKLIITGWADLGKIAKALKKTRKLATICSGQEPSLPIEPRFENDVPPPDHSNSPSAESVEPTEHQNPPPEPSPAQPKEADEVHVVQRYPQDHSERYNQEEVIYNASVEYYSSLPHPQYKHEPPQPIRVNHSYNTYKPTPYVTKYDYAQPPPQDANHNRPEPPQQFTHYNKREPPPQQTHYGRPQPPQQFTHYNRPEPLPQKPHYTRPEPPQQFTHYNKPEPPPQQTHYTIPQPPQQFTHYNKPETLSEYTHYNNRPEPSLQYTQYNIPEPPQSYTNYARPEPESQPYTNYVRPESPPHDTHYGGEYYGSSNGNGNITSIFSDENPNSCTIV